MKKTCDTDCEIVPSSLSDVANQVCAVVELFWVILPLLVNVRQIASQGEDIPQTQSLRLLQVSGDILLGGPNAGHVKHRLHTDVLDGAVCNHHARRLRISSRVARRVPCYV